LSINDLSDYVDYDDALVVRSNRGSILYQNLRVRNNHCSLVARFKSNVEARVMPMFTFTKEDLFPSFYIGTGEVIQNGTGGSGNHSMGGFSIGNYSSTNHGEVDVFIALNTTDIYYLKAEWDVFPAN